MALCLPSMNRFKSVFIIYFFALINLALLHVSTVSWHSELGAGWVGVFVMTLFYFYHFVLLFRGKKARSSRNLHFLMAMNLTGYAMVLTDPGMEANPWPLMLGSLVFFSSIAYIFWYPNLGERKHPNLEAGKKLPRFVLKRPDGTSVQSDEGGQRRVWVFIQGNWNPVCMAQLRELAANFIDFDRLALKFTVVSLQPADKTAELAKRFETPMDILMDENGQAARNLGLFWADGVPFGLHFLGHGKDTQLPTVLVTNEHGRIVYADFTDNLRIRPEVNHILEAARQKFAQE